MKIPKQIHFCGKTYSVTETNSLDDGRNIGKTVHDKLKISIEKDMPIQMKEETFFHELLHIAYAHSGKIISSEDEEKLVESWSRNMYGILKDNNLLK